MSTSVSDQRAHRRRAVVASTVGTTIEWYDFFLYGSLDALVFPKVFFPGSAPAEGILASFATLFVGFAARPVGAAIFGHFGDRVGRKATLITTLLLTGIGTTLIGVLPGYGAIGIAAPILLTLLRVVQGIGVGGEWGGAVLMSMEWGDASRRGLVTSLPQLGVPLGLLLSTGVMQVDSALSGAAFTAWAWRIPLLLSVVLIGVGLWVRLRVAESPAFAVVKRERTLERQPVWAAIRNYPREILILAFVRLSEQAPFYLFITFVLTYGTQALKLPRGQLLTDILIAAMVGLVNVPLFGHLSDRFGRRLVCGVGVVATGLFAFPYFGLLETRSAGLVLLAIVVSLVVHDIQHGPQAALIAESFDVNVRYSGAGLGYQLASVIAGGPAPLIAAALLAATGSSVGISWYIVACSVISLVALVLMPHRREAGGARRGGPPAVAAVRPRSSAVSDR